MVKMLADLNSIRWYNVVAASPSGCAACQQRLVCEYGDSMTNESNLVNTGAWKEIQTAFHNFKVIENLGMLFTTPQSKSKKRFVRVECLLCGQQYNGSYQCFKTRDKVCKCESRKGKGCVKASSLKRDRIVKILAGMRYRCYHERSAYYKNYGGKGIIIHQEWLNDRDSFVEWALNNGYDDELTIDRIDSDKNYCPENCRWLTRLENIRSKKGYLTIHQVIQIKKLITEGMKVSKIADNMNVSHAQVSSIKYKNSWVDIE